MEEWKEYKLQEIVDINPTESLKKGTVAKKIGMDILQPYTRAIPSYTLEPFSGGTKFRNGDTIMARITPCLENGKTAMVNILDKDEIGFGSTEYIVFRAKEGITDPFFIYYLVVSSEIREPAIKSMVCSSGRQRVQTDVVANLSIKLPSLPTQQKIAAILSSLDDKIELNNKINENLEQQAQDLFKSWFIDFEPFGGKMPEGWKEGQLSDVADYFNGYPFGSKELFDSPSEECYDVFKQGHIRKGGGFNSDGTKSWYPISKCEKLQNYVLKKGDILMAMTDMKGNVAILGNTAIMPVDDKYIVNQRVGLLRAKKDIGVDYPYLYLLTNEHNFLMDLRSRANSGVQVNLSSTAIKESEICVATKKDYEDFNYIVKPLFETILENQLENKQLATIRDTLLPKLMNGEIDIIKK